MILLSENSAELRSGEVCSHFLGEELKRGAENLCLWWVWRRVFLSHFREECLPVSSSQQLACPSLLSQANIL
jgi:hypothetical protein